MISSAFFFFDLQTPYFTNIPTTIDFFANTDSIFFNVIYLNLVNCTETFFFLDDISWFLLHKELFEPTIRFDFNLKTQLFLKFDDVSYFDNLTNVTSLYQYSIPTTKLAYPEPFIASASFMHSDLWFIHILIYQYWLWFVFIFLIIFFFLTFVSVVRWCNMRTRPRRETRGVSRSKCGDLITACVPVSWAASIIINESTDAIDFYDGFGTSELVVGIRAYQWGWEYYYPKDIDLNYNIKKNYTSFIGNSLKYDTSTRINLQTNNLWKFYQAKSMDHVTLPAHFLLFSGDNAKLLNFLNFNDLGANSLQETSAFRKTKSFFKFTNPNTFNNSSLFLNFYKRLGNAYFNESLLLSSNTYGLKRQNNLLSSLTTDATKLTFLGEKNLTKFVKYNCKNQKQHELRIGKYNYFFKKLQLLDKHALTLYFKKLIDKTSSFTTIFALSKFYNYNDILHLINLNTDKKRMRHPASSFFNPVLWKKKFFNATSHNQLNFEKELTYFTNNNNYLENVIKKNFSVFASNDSISTPNKNIRNFVNLNSSNSFLKSHSTLNSIFANTDFSQTFSLLNNFQYYNSLKTKELNLVFFNNIVTNKIYLDSPVAPINASNFLTALEYDNSSISTIANTPIVLQGKEDLLPTWIVSAYWNFYWNQNDIATRFENNFFYQRTNYFFYFPIFNFSYDYDFRNWQSIELLEDAFWESSFPTSIYEEYLSMFNDNYEYQNISKHESFFDFETAIYKNFFTDTLNLNYSQFLYFDEFLLNPKLVKSEKFLYFPLITILNNIDETYEIFKTSIFNSLQTNNIFFNTIWLSDNQRSAITITNAFRSDYEDLTWDTDLSNFKTTAENLIFFKNNSFLLTDNEVTYNNDSVVRFDNIIHLRDTTKNEIVTYNALQKVFRTRFDEGRSNTRLMEFANFYSKQPYLSSARTLFEKTIGKTKNDFYKINFYKISNEFSFNSQFPLYSALNFYTYDFPFLIANKSDASRHIWFDWFSKWGFYEVQPSSSARYAIHGMPHFNKFFNFTSSQNETLNETESYLLRLSKARKNYLPNWAYTPYFYAKNNFWYKNNLLNVNFIFVNKLLLTDIFLANSLNYEAASRTKKNLFVPFTLSNSNMNSYAKSLWKPSANVESYYFNLSSLLDILTRREFLYRQFLSNRNKIVMLPSYAINNPTNNLSTDIKTLFMFADPIVYNNEYSREYYYNSLNLFYLHLTQTFLKSENHISKLVSNFFYYFFDISKENLLSENSQLYKNQYRPLRKGINNMLRLHATGAIAMPIEIRLQILASSKDVIHSWAVPSAGIKIDCVPGYSSHKIMIFLVSGIFWGQCMEICGRYHHWMPIVVYFMKRDLFFLWCSHFVLTTNNNSPLNDRYFNDITRTVSYDKNSWITELIN